MAQEQQSSSSSGDKNHPIWGTLRLLLILGVIVWALKLTFLSTRQDRPQELCYFPHKLYRWAYVDAYHAIFIDDHVSKIRASQQVKSSYFQCVAWAQTQDWLDWLDFWKNEESLTTPQSNEVSTHGRKQQQH